MQALEEGTPIYLLARNSHCAITVPDHDVDVVVEGEAVTVRDNAKLHQVADAFLSKNSWCHPAGVELGRGTQAGGRSRTPLTGRLPAPRPSWAR